MNDWDLDTPAQKKTPPSQGAPTKGMEPAPSAAPVRPPGFAPEARPRPAPDRPVPVRIQRGRARFLAVWVAAALVILLVGIFVGFFIARSQTTGDAAVLTESRAQLGQLQRALSQTEDRNWSYYRENEALKTELEQARSAGQTSTSSTVPGSPGTERVYGDGVYVVDEDIAPGAYDGVVTGEVGYWARLKDTDGSASAIITNAIPRGPFVLTIYPADNAVELRGVQIRSR